jgi:hypothetical protein
MALRRLRLAMARNEEPYREGHSVYINRVEGPVRLRDAAGNLTNAGREYIARGGSENSTRLFPVDVVPWRQGRRTFAEAIPDIQGRRRQFEIMRRQFNRPQPRAGMLFEGHSQSRFIVHMPVRVRYPRDGGGWSRPYDEDENGPVTIPISEEEVLRDYADILLPELRNYREAYTEADLERTTATVREAMAAYLHHHAGRNARFDGEIVAAQTSDVVYTVDPRNIMDRPGWRFDLEHTFRDHGRPETEVILGRPQRGVINMPDEM